MNHIDAACLTVICLFFGVPYLMMQYGAITWM